MCTRFSPLTREEADRVLAARKATGRATLSQDETRLDPMHDAYPGSKVPVFIPSPTGNLTVAVLSWGFPLEGRQNAVFNTRIETALAQLSSNRRGMWADAIANGRCLVPVRAFYESHGSERVGSEHTGRLVRRQYRFCFPGASAFLLAALLSRMRMSRRFTRACRSCSAPGSRASGSAQGSEGSPTEAAFASTAARNDSLAVQWPFSSKFLIDLLQVDGYISLQRPQESQAIWKSRREQ